MEHGDKLVASIGQRSGVLYLLVTLEEKQSLAGGLSWVSELVLTDTMRVLVYDKSTAEKMFVAISRVDMSKVAVVAHRPPIDNTQDTFVVSAWSG